MAQDAGPKVVVGIDGSEASKAALRWAIGYARTVGGSVEVVHVWDYPAMALARFGESVVPVIAREDLEKAADDLTINELADVLDGNVPVPVDVKVEVGHPATVLVHDAEDADLLVVGARGRGGFASLLLGSVSSQVVHHASVPVVVIPADRRARAGAAA